ncbi:restriction endonuclease fold toxin-2 domain-containing protein [Streptomyces violascens]|uniref:restriction endonuclease fold toxin-2 domain-containing protein n=1 Tax=Streptomyces violascens TaxID=67381 RepID=UPI0037B5E882
MGMPADLGVISGDMIKAAMTMVESVMPGARDTAIAVSGELSRQHGMAGDDEAGAAFAKVYNSAAVETLDQMGFSAYVMGGTGRGLMSSAREFVMAESHVASQILGKQVDLTQSMGDPAEDCTQNFLGLGQELPEVVGETSKWDQYAPGGNSDRFRGSPEKLRDVAGTWRRGGQLMLRFLEDAQACAQTADKAHSGDAADSFRSYFKGFVGFAPPPERAQQDEPLVANLVAACMLLAKACDRYADHVEDAKKKIQQDKLDLFHVTMPWDSPMFGGNGDDGGLKNAVLDDPWIHQLGDVAHALDASNKRVKLPHGAGDGPSFPFLPPLIRLPVLVPVAYRVPDPSVPWAPPLPPVPGTTTPLSLAESKDFTTWVNGLKPSDYGNGRDSSDPENAYQLRTAGYPERIIPLPSTARKGAIAADGMRPSDGYMVDAKYVRNTDPDCKKETFRKPSTFDIPDAVYPEDHPKAGQPKWTKKSVLMKKDVDELGDYADAMQAHKQIRGLEIITNDRDSAAYWQILAAQQGVRGTTRYEP